MKKISHLWKITALMATMPILMLANWQPSLDTGDDPAVSERPLPARLSSNGPAANNQPDTGSPGMLNARIIVINY